MTFHITINLDEISENLDDSLRFLNELSIRSCELRLINGKNIIHLSDKELLNLKKKLKKYNIFPISITSPLFKWKLGVGKEDIEIDSYGVSPDVTVTEQCLYIKKIIFIARFFDIKYIRIFGGVGCSIEEFLKNELFLTLLEDENITFLIENELGTSVSTKKDLMTLVKFIEKNSISNLKIWFDIANYFRVDKNVIEPLIKYKKYIFYIHCKNFIMVDKKIKYVELNKGVIDFETIIKAIKQNFTNLIFSLELHEKEECKKKRTVRNSYLVLSEYINGGRR